MVLAHLLLAMLGAPPDPAFEAQHRGQLEVESVSERTLDAPWPPGRYRVLRLRPVRTGSLAVGYTFTRTRTSGPEQVERRFAIHVIADDDPRPAVLDAPHHRPVRLRDRVELAVPLADPWGKLSDLRWLPPDPNPHHGPFEPRDDGCATPRPVVPEALTLVAVRCTITALRSGRPAFESWALFRARAPGKAGRLEVVPGPRIVPMQVWHERITRTESGTVGPVVDTRAPHPLTVGDQVWLRL